MVHLHSAQLHTVPNLLDVEEIAAIEITPDFGEDMVPKLPLMAQILGRKPLLVHGVMSLASAKEIMRTLPARGLALIFRCDTPADAARESGFSLLRPRRPAAAQTPAWTIPSRTVCFSLQRRTWVIAPR